MSPASSVTVDLGKKVSIAPLREDQANWPTYKEDFVNALNARGLGKYLSGSFVRPLRFEYDDSADKYFKLDKDGNHTTNELTAEAHKRILYQLPKTYLSLSRPLQGQRLVSVDPFLLHPLLRNAKAFQALRQRLRLQPSCRALKWIWVTNSSTTSIVLSPLRRGKAGLRVPSHGLRARVSDLSFHWISTYPRQESVVFRRY